MASVRTDQPAPAHSAPPPPGRRPDRALPQLAWGLIAGVAWVVVYANLAGVASWAAYDLAGLTRGSHLASAVEFFVFEAPKVLMLLVLVVFLSLIHI